MHTETRDYYPEADDVEFDYYAYLHSQRPLLVDAELTTPLRVVETAEQLAVLLAIAQNAATPSSACRRLGAFKPVQRRGPFDKFGRKLAIRVDYGQLLLLFLEQRLLK